MFYKLAWKSWPTRFSPQGLYRDHVRNACSCAHESPIFQMIGVLLSWQVELYRQLIRSSTVMSLLSSPASTHDSSALSCIMALRKLCNHPDMLFAGDNQEASGMEADLHPLYPAGYQLDQPQHSGEPEPASLLQ